MRLTRHLDISVREIDSLDYDLILYASGYEARATALCSRLGWGTKSSMRVLGFAESRDEVQRERNDHYYRDQCECDPQIIAADDESGVYALLRDALKTDSEELRLLVDYSSMPRAWYGSVLNWVRYSEIASVITVDLVYACGEYEGDYPLMTVQRIVPVPGCRGLPAPAKDLLAVFGLGFDGLAPLTLYETLEPRLAYGLVASPGSSDGYVDAVLDRNNDFIANECQHLAYAPIGSVSDTYRSLMDLIWPYVEDWNIAIVPLGPKTHVLASILVCYHFPEIACLRPLHVRSTCARVQPSGEFSCVRLVFEEGLERPTWMRSEAPGEI